MSFNTDRMPSPEISPLAQTASDGALESISIHYRPGEDPYWTEESGGDNPNDGDKDGDEDEDGEWLPLMLDDPTDGRNGYASGDDGFHQQWHLMPSPDSIMVHLEGQTSDELGRVFIEPSGIDTSILRKLRDGDTENDTRSWRATSVRCEEYTAESEGPFAMSPHGMALSDSEAVAQLLTYQNSKYTDITPHNNAERFTRQSSVLRSLLQHGADVYPAPSFASSVPHVLSDPMLTRLWVRNQMQGSWKIKYRKALAVERTALKARGNSAELIGNEEEKQTVASAKRKLRRKVFNDCVRDALLEIGHELQKSLREPLQDIEGLAAIWKGQQCLLLSEHYTISEAFATLSQHQETLSSILPNAMADLEDRVDAVCKLLDSADSEMRKMQTRHNRLCANDVKDPADRKLEMEARLQKPEALVYILKSWEGLEMVREVAWAVVERFEDVEGGLGELEMVGVECCVAGEGVVLLGEVK